MKLKHIKEFDEYSKDDEHLNEDLGGFIKDLWQEFTSLVDKFFGKEQAIPAQPKVDPHKELRGQHMLYLPHQQGPAGAANIFNVIKSNGKIKLGSNIRYKMLNNIPTSDPNYIKVKNGNDKEAASAFLSYQMNTWNKFKKEALLNIKDPKNAKVKSAILNIKNKQLPDEFLVTVAFKESSFNTNPKNNRSYVGLYQIGDMAWQQLKRINGEKYKGRRAPIDPIKNAQAGHDYLKWSYEQFQKLIK